MRCYSALFGRVQFLGWIIVSLAIWSEKVNADIVDGFEGGRTRWQYWDSDANCQIKFQQISVFESHSGATSEVIVVGCQTGSYAHLVYPIRPTAIIKDLTASLWVRASPGGMSIGFRVVFPQTVDPGTGRPLARVLSGSKSKGGGAWSLVEIRDPERLLAQIQPVVRRQYPDADLRNAYIDAVVLDCYTSLPGIVSFQIDDLTVSNMFDARDVEPQSSVLEAESRQDMATIVATKMSERRKDIRASLPRWLQYNGENLFRLKTLGFTGIVLSQPPESDLLNEAKQSGIDVISPPPGMFPLNAELPDWSAVSMWFLGSALDSAQLESARQLSQRLTQLPTSLMRPSIAEALENSRSYSRITDLLAIPIPIGTTMLDGREQIQAIQQSLSEARSGTLGIVSMVTEPLPEWTQQRKQIAAALPGNPFGTTDSLEFDRLQTRLGLYRSISSGAHGWLYRSLGNLESGDSQDVARMESLQGLNAELSLLAPWIQEAQPPTPVTSLSSAEYIGTVHSLPNAKLIILQATGKFDQLCPTAPQLPEIVAHVPQVGQSNQVVRISNVRPEALNFQTTGGVVRFTISRPGWVEMIVVTSDQKVLEFLHQRSTSMAPIVADARMDIANQQFSLANMALIAERIPPNHSAWNAIASARTKLDAATQYMTRSDFAKTIDSAEQSALHSQTVIRASWIRATEQFTVPQSSPLTVSSLSLPHHWQLNQALQDRTWQSVLLPGGEMNEIKLMTEIGWTQDPRLVDQVECQVEIAPLSAPDGSGSLHLVSRSRTGQPIVGGYSGAVLRIRSPKVVVPKGNLIRIDGLVRVRSGKGVPNTGLLIYDNMAGPALGQLVQFDATVSERWQRISLFRMATDDQGLRILLELRGEGEFYVDQLAVSIINPSPFPAYELSPYQELGDEAAIRPRSNGRLILQPQP